MVKSGFFNAVKNNDGSFDRAYNSEDINKYFKGAISENGIYKFVGNQCKVNTYSGMSVLVKDGKGAIKYHWFEMETDEAITINDAHPTLSRYTAIVMRYDETNRQIGLATIDGEYEEIPSKPEIIRNSSVYDICLAYVYVEAGATEITIDKIEDTREDESLCGFVKTLLDNGSSEGIPRVDVLPMAQVSEVGKVYYLKVAYSKYVPDFYTCKKVVTYDFKPVIMTEGLISDRPDASFAYANQVYHATDEDKYYACKKNESELYEWQEITVNIESSLPLPSIETLDNYYLVDGELSYGISATVYDWVSFQGGGASFAYLAITYTEGEVCSVTHGGVATNAPDKSGFWLFGCEEAGEYVVKLGTQQQTIEITYKNQIENVIISEQVIHSQIIYLLGDENEEFTGGIDTTSYNLNAYMMTHNEIATIKEFPKIALVSTMEYAYSGYHRKYGNKSIGYGGFAGNANFQHTLIPLQQTNSGKAVYISDVPE
ncbi:MAG: hypothetical protein MJ151_02000, partial [Lachnospiraceae bacterium]|nr:hypothetical protein [Lachnospiraceae bacterium]